VTISDFNSCILAQSFTISQPLLLVLDAQVTDVSCFADSTGSVDLAVTGGIVPYEILWSNGETTEDITGLPAGIYTVSVTDGNECLGTGSYNVSEPSSLISVNIISTDLNCFSDTSGAADLTVSGGNAPYNYLWSNGATTQDLEGLTMGSYIVTVSDSGLCSVTSDAYIGPANQVTAEAMISSNYNGFAVSCYGASDGNINLDINGGTPPYNILWSNGMNNQNLYNVDAGYYQVTVTDITGCKDIDTVVLVSPPQLSISETVAYPTCPDFADGSVVITVTGGLEPYSYLWSNLEVTPSITGIPAGIYTITVSDANNCFLTDELNLPNLFEECIFIPSAFTPNNDGFNDVWNIRGIELYPQTIIEVFNRWGQLLFKSDIGYHEKWDGKYNGNELPSDTYHYVVTLKEGMEPIIGTVTIIR
jgi:gliding motility-associated-like protein